MPPAKKPPTCNRCGKVFSSRQAKYNHKMVECHAVEAVAEADGSSSSVSLNVDSLSASLGKLLQKFSENPSDVEAAVREYSSNLATTIDMMVRTRTDAMVHDAPTDGTHDAPHFTVVGDHARVTVNNFRIVCTNHIDHGAMAELIKARDLRASLQKVVEMVHFDPGHPENMNAYISNTLSDHGYSYQQGLWQMRPRNDIAKGVMLNAGSLMNEHNDDPYARDFTRAQTQRFEKFYDVFDREKTPLIDTIDTIVKHKGSVERVHPELRALG